MNYQILLNLERLNRLEIKKLFIKIIILHHKYYFP
jgi:hypothetical protein